MSKKKRRRLVPSIRCTATNRWGEPCKAWAMKGSVVCSKHGGMAPQVRRKAQERILMAQDDAASLLVQFMSDGSVPYSERRRCAEFLLTYETRNEVKLTLDLWQQDIEGLVYAPDEREREIIDAEVVEDEPRAIPPSDYEFLAEEADVVSITDQPPRYARGPRRRSR